MRLINTSSLALKDFVGESSGPYAILSHRWQSAEQELTYKDYCKGRKHETSGYKKILEFCRIVRQDGLRWAWVDTCCIDKSSSAELSEAINSMFRWYSRATVCYVFLTDAGPGRPWQESQWWHRGWTLQELIAPREVIFFNRFWVRIGTRSGLCESHWNIPSVTGVPSEVLRRPKAFLEYSVAQRMSWAIGRSVTRIEDRAYSLLGLFQINMPLLYGEGRRAFRRLQLEILQKYPDETVLAWFSTEPVNYEPHGVLAGSPDDFYRWGGMEQWSQSSTQIQHRNRSTPPRVTSWGIELRAPAIMVRALPPALGRFRRIREVIRTTENNSTGNEGNGPVCWALTLTTLSPAGSTVEFPCTLILTQRDSNSNVYHRRECIDWKGYDVRNAHDFFAGFFADQYKILADEEERLFYLHCGDDYDDDDDDHVEPQSTQNNGDEKICPA